MKIEWDHHPESLAELEYYTSTIDGIYVSIYVIAEDCYAWSTYQSGPNWGHGVTKNLDVAMAEAIKYIKNYLSEKVSDVDS